MGKLLSFNTEARERLLEGARKLSEAVGSTLGPKGSNVAIARQYGPPIVMHDGVSVAREIDLVDPYENMGTQLLKEAASKTNDAAGDGTTTATILGYAIASEAHKNITAGANPMMLRKGIDIAVEAMKKELDNLSTPIEGHKEILQVATISAQNDEIGQVVADGIERMGKDGVLAVEESSTTQTYLEIKEGMEFNQGWISPYFVTNAELRECVLDNPYIFLTDMKLSTLADVGGWLNKFVTEPTENKNLLIIAEDMVGDALAITILNNAKGSFRVCVVKAPGFGDVRKDMLKDIAVVTGAKYFSSDLGSKITAENFKITDLGRADKVTSIEKNTVIVEGKGNPKYIKSRITELKNTSEKAETDFIKEKLQERIARLTTGIGIIFVGASSETEMRERKERFIDGISATKAAMDEGVVPGGETALIRAAMVLETLEEKGDIQLGIDLVRRASEQPFRKLMSNAGYDDGRMLSELEMVLSKKNFGIDVIDAKQKDMVKSGIIDPVKVTKQALGNAASVAVMMLSTNVLVVEEPKKEQPQYD